MAGTHICAHAPFESDSWFACVGVCVGVQCLGSKAALVLLVLLSSCCLGSQQFAAPICRGLLRIRCSRFFEQICPVEVLLLVLQPDVLPVGFVWDMSAAHSSLTALLHGDVVNSPPAGHSHLSGLWRA